MAQTNKKEYKIAFMPSGKRGSFPEGTTILDASIVTQRDSWDKKTEEKLFNILKRYKEKTRC